MFHCKCLMRSDMVYEYLHLHPWCGYSEGAERCYLNIAVCVGGYMVFSYLRYCHVDFRRYGIMTLRLQDSYLLACIEWNNQLSNCSWLHFLQPLNTKHKGHVKSGLRNRVRSSLAHAGGRGHWWDYRQSRTPQHDQVRVAMCPQREAIQRPKWSAPKPVRLGGWGHSPSSFPQCNNMCRVVVKGTIMRCVDPFLTPSESRFPLQLI